MEQAPNDYTNSYEQQRLKQNDDRYEDVTKVDEEESTREVSSLSPVRENPASAIGLPPSKSNLDPRNDASYKEVPFTEDENQQPDDDRNDGESEERKEEAKEETPPRTPKPITEDKDQQPDDDKSNEEKEESKEEAKEETPPPTPKPLALMTAEERKLEGNHQTTGYVQRYAWVMDY